jgi:hypothetical protein
VFNPSPACGAPDWCGQCSCPPQPITPYGEFSPCDEETPCPSEADYPDRLLYASVCHPESLQCVECASDADCADPTPSCALYLNRCVACANDSDCGAELPACISQEYASVETRRCHECSNDAQCDVGLCSSNFTCVPECTSDAECAPSDLMVCDMTTQRCAARPCDGGQCPGLGACAGTACERATCASDADCPTGNYCVNTRCYDQPGYCVDVYIEPVP